MKQVWGAIGNKAAVGIVASSAEIANTHRSAQTPAFPPFVSHFGHLCTFEERFGSCFGMR